MTRFTSIFVLIFAILPAFSQSRSGGQMPETQISLAISGQNTTNMATLYTPRGKGPFAAVLLLPGGNGAKLIGVAYAHHEAFARRLAQQGFAAMVLNYRDTNRVFMDNAWIQDISAALDSLKSQINIDSSRIFLLGFSMGGTNALRTAARRHDIRGLVCYFSPVDFSQRKELMSRPGFVQPITLVDSLQCPLLILQGDADSITKPEQSVQLEQRAKAKGLTVKRVLYAGGKHGFTYQGTRGMVEYNQVISDSSFADVLTFLNGLR